MLSSVTKNLTRASRSNTGTDNGETWTIRGVFEDKHLLRRNGKPLLLHSVHKKRDENRKIVSSAKDWRLRMEGHTSKNKTKRYAIEYVQMWQQQSEDVDHVSAAMSIKSIERFLIRCGHDRQDVRGEGLPARRAHAADLVLAKLEHLERGAPERLEQ